MDKYAIEEERLLNIIKELENTNSSNNKLSILMENKDNETLKNVFRLAYSPTINFFIKNIPQGWQHNDKMNTQMDTVFEHLKLFSDRVITGNKAKDELCSMLNSIDCDLADIVVRILKKDMKCGVGRTLINKVWKGLIVVPPRMGASSMNEKSLKKMNEISNLAIELKSDGSYAAAVCGENTELMSRNGNKLNIPSLQEHLSCGAFDWFALEGELVYDLNKATREEGNGHINRIVKNTASQEHLDNVHYQVWDCIDASYYEPKGEYPFTNQERRYLLLIMYKEYIDWCDSKNISPRVSLIERKENVTVKEAMNIFEGYVRDGFEGAIVKDMDEYWYDKSKPTHCIKLKRKEPADLIVVGVFEGKVGSKYVGMLGGFHCESSCGKIKVDVGSGFSDAERLEFFNNPPPIIEVEYDSITEDKRTKQKSLFLPIYKRPRYDKSHGDSYQEILDKIKIK